MVTRNMITTVLAVVGLWTGTAVGATILMDATTNNGGFEDSAGTGDWNNAGAQPGWTAWSASGAYTGTGWTGATNKIARVNGLNNYLLSDPIGTVAAGDWYVLSGKLGSTAVGTESSLQLLAQDPNGVEDDVLLAELNHTAVTAWALSPELQTTSSAAGAAIDGWDIVVKLDVPVDYSGRWHATDDITVEAVPEPTSLALLGLGAVGFLRRRCR